jgi:hypothetical protein
MTDKSDSRQGKPDEELDELLDSKSRIEFNTSWGKLKDCIIGLYSFSGALGDFDKVAMKETPTSSETKPDDDCEDPPMETLWNDEFIQQQAKMFEKQMSEMFGAGNKEVTPEQLNLGFQRIAEVRNVTRIQVLNETLRFFDL